jgi:hypothetical protein
MNDHDGHTRMANLKRLIMPSADEDLGQLNISYFPDRSEKQHNHFSNQLSILL